jgi:hypothetical protein
MYASKKWIALVSRANDSWLMIGKDHLLRWPNVAPQAILMVHATSVVTYGQSAQACLKHCGDRAYTQLIGATRRLLDMTIADIPLSRQSDSKLA